MNVERDVLAVLVLADVERHIIVDVVGSETDVECLHLTVAVNHLDIAHLCLLLHRQKKHFL